MSHLERAEDRFWLSQALLGLSYACYTVGDFNSTLEATARLDSVGEVMSNRRVRANAAMLAGLSLATRGDYEVGIEALQRALELSPDEFETAWILACLGKANLEAGDTVSAVPLLEQAVEMGDRLRSRQFQAWFRTLLGEAYILGKRIDEARDLILKALEISMDIQYMLGVGLAESALGRIAQAEGSVEEAEGQFVKALQTFISLGARFEIARTYLDLAILARSRGDQKAAATHIQEARSLFKDLKIPKYVERVEQMAKDVDAH